MASESTDAAGCPEPATVPVPGALAVRAADRALCEVYLREYQPLVRLAVLLLDDVPAAEEAVQEAFIAMHSNWRRLRDTDKALSYLRRAVVSKSRSVLRHRAIAGRNAPEHVTDKPSAESRAAAALLERSAITAALRGLPARQREAIVLRYYTGLPEAETAATMEISRGAVKSHVARAMTTLKSTLRDDAMTPRAGARNGVASAEPAGRADS